MSVSYFLLITLVGTVAEGPGIHNKSVLDKRHRKKKNNGMQLLVPEEGALRLTETVKDSSGSVVSSNEFSATLFTIFRPRITCNHVLNITNAGAGPVTVDATFGYIPFISAPLSEESQLLAIVDLSSLSAIIPGGLLLTAIGFIQSSPEW